MTHTEKAAVPDAAQSANGIEFATTVWSRNVTQPLAMAVMVTAVFVGITNVLHAVLQEDVWLSLGFLFFVTALEGIYTTLWLANPERRLLERPLYRAAEFVFLALLVRLIAWLVAGAQIPTLDAIRLSLREPLTVFADRFFLISLFLIFLSWQFAIRLANIFGQLAISPEEAHYYSQPPHEQTKWSDSKPIRVNRGYLAQAFFRTWIWGGFTLALCAGLSTLELPDLSTQDLWNPLAMNQSGLRPEMLGALISYFLSGFWLTSQARLEVMNARWLIDRIQRHPMVAQRWQRNSLFLLLIIAAIAAFLPIGSTLPISRILGLIVATLLYVINLIFYLISILFALFVAFLSLLTGSSNREQEQLDPIPSFQQAVDQQQTIIPPNETAALITSSLFWTALIFVTVSAVLFFLRERGVALNRDTIRRLWHALRLRLRALWQTLSRQMKTLQKELQRRAAVVAAPPASERSESPWRFVRINGLSPRNQVRYFYLSIVQRAGKQGVSRKPDETPLEYAASLKQEWPDEESELDQLTEAFLTARYSAKEIEAAEANRVKAVWKRVKAFMRRSKS